MDGINQMLTLRDNAKSQLMQIKSVEDGMTYLNKLSAIDSWVKAEKKDAELQNIVAEQKLRTQRILGTLLKDSEIKKGGNGNNQYANVPKGNNSTLSDYGLNRKQSSTFQQIASIPEETFENFIQEKKEAVNNAVAELTTTGAVRLAKSLKEKQGELKVTMQLNEQINTEKELKDLAHHINMTYTKDQRIFLINFIKI